MKKLSEREKTTTPVFFKHIRNTGLIITSMATAVLLAPIDLPVSTLYIAGYIFIGGIILTASCHILITDTANTTIKRR